MCACGVVCAVGVVWVYMCESVDVGVACVRVCMCRCGCGMCVRVCM